MVAQAAVTAAAATLAGVWWILVWALLVVGAVLVIGALVWRLVRQAIALGRTVGESASRAGDALTAPADAPPGAATTSVFLDPDAPGGPDAQPFISRPLRPGRRRA